MGWAAALAFCISTLNHLEWQSQVLLLVCILFPLSESHIWSYLVKRWEEDSILGHRSYKQWWYYWKDIKKKKIWKLTLIFGHARERDSEDVSNVAHTNVDKTKGWPSTALLGSTGEKDMWDHFRVSGGGLMILRVHGVESVLSTRDRTQTNLLRKINKQTNKQSNNPNFSTIHKKILKLSMDPSLEWWW